MSDKRPCFVCNHLDLDARILIESLVVAADDETARGRFCGLSVREVLGTWHTDTDCKQLQLRD